jgi:cystathionine gamma-lyase/cystathionine gamma-lyase/homocysteine desulfhydrase
LLFLDLEEELAAHYPVLLQSLKLFNSGTGMACVTSMIAQPFTGSHASMSEEEKKAMGLGKDTIRLSFGLEDTEDLKQDLLYGFKVLKEAALAELNS